ncbi:hypothetical protein ACQEU8_02365 [Streptomyces sp. CA-250714]|uniref:hypothetical protein n=1 Tax=Streptomyces sp. CA-250714 TaxID=3240060 RepID=UPI003D913538
MPDLTPGEKMRWTARGSVVTIKAGPFVDMDGQFYVATDVDGMDRIPLAKHLLPLPEDPRVELVAKAICGDDHVRGAAYSWEEQDAMVREQYRNSARAALNALDETAVPAPLAVGDRIRILEDDHNDADVRRDDVLIVERVAAHGIFTADGWVFRHGDEGTGWERA